jgi:hypothetical protein
VLGFRVQGFCWNMLIFILILGKSFNLNISTKSQQDPSIFHHGHVSKEIPKRSYSSFFNLRSCKFKTKLKSKPTKQQYKYNFQNMNKKIKIKNVQDLSLTMKKVYGLYAHAQYGQSTKFLLCTWKVLKF